MITNATFELKRKARDSYLDLVTTFPLASIQSEEHLEAAQQVLDLLSAHGRLDDGERMYVAALSDLVAAYEDEHYRIELASDADMLRHLMGVKGVTQAELSRAAGVAKSTVSEILSGKKPFTRRVIRKLADYFAVDVGVLSANL